ncbi:MAG TPA: ABC transporter ATP-binding protein [Burkholderiaceae bacterium]|nr:ABC transporter ATP-binding protein [Burkholderiaceae bacterium]
MSLLEARAIRAGYGDFQALHGIDFRVEPGEAVAIIGANGAGKTTFLRAIAGQLPLSQGNVRFDGQALDGWPAQRVAAAGMAMVPEGRMLFPSLNVEENLLIGGYSRRAGPWNLQRVYALFPILREFRLRNGTELSGGQQQMVAVGRALMANPKLLLCDEISLGLAPVVVRDIYRTLPQIRAEGMAIVLVEQDIGQALKVADRVACFQEGRVALEGIPGELTREQITLAYFGS